MQGIVASQSKQTIGLETLAGMINDWIGELEVVLEKMNEKATTPAGTGVLQEGDGMPETVGTDVH